jgi:ATP-binding cassette subfamily F protein uup
MRAISVQEITKYLGGRPLFEKVSFTLTERDRCGLIGRNGCGKSTILKIISGQLTPDDGKVVVSPSLRLGVLPQNTDYSDQPVTVEQLVAKGGTKETNVVREALKICGFEDPGVLASTLSGGWQKRLAFAEMLSEKPDFLILDEPTNHLDFDGLWWLGRTLSRFEGGFLMVSHDRAVLRDYCTQFLEVSPFGFIAVKGSYDDYRLVRAESIRQLERERDKVANIARRELDWLRSGAKARSTKAKARINTAEASQVRASELNRISKQEDTTALAFSTSQHLGRELLVAKNLSVPPIWEHMPDLTLTPGTRMCVVGPNGCGKSTLLKILRGDIEPVKGYLRRGPSVQYGVFDQHKLLLDPHMTVEEALRPPSGEIRFGGRQYNPVSWARKFAFDGSQLRSRVQELSGGEQSRLLLAQVMSQPADILLFDEPTNDLDIFARDALDEALQSFPGAIVLVTHDRYLIENVATQVLGLVTAARWELFGDLSQWERAVRESSQSKRAPAVKEKSVQRRVGSALSGKEKRELVALEAKIATLEEESVETEKLLSSTGDGDTLVKLSTRLHEVCEELEQAMEQWADLEARK